MRVIDCIYSFIHRDCSNSQDDGDIREVINLLRSFTQSNERDEEISEKLLTNCEWLPLYGSVLIWHDNTSYEDSLSWNLVLLGLDEWEFDINSKLFGKRSYTSHHGNYVRLSVGDVPKCNLLTLLEFFKTLIKNQKKKQFTPAYVQAALVYALEIYEEDLSSTDLEPVVARGAFTDVGLHTG